ncbi:Di-copper centre-containing protein [Diaporthe eres]|uniref:Tyrosinase copper-binding domain-containing protein n=1 Tax=Diaporthe vaccinii TaxID=105482 RepID=A0ABR4E290_9PEZI|nr:Di-copper centre-containing protein [Diaporthe eres]
MLPIVLAGHFIVLAAALPTHDNATTGCREPPVRKEWRALSNIQQRSYIDAVLCLQDISAKSGFEPAKNRFDDFQAIHSNQTPNIHWVGHFILWHRYFVATYEKALREECGYEGGQPYWGWSLDASLTNNGSTAIYETAIFDPTYGFGGNGPYVEATAEQNPLNITGHTGGGCVTAGPFTYPGFKINVPSTGCLKRDFTPWIMNYFAQQALVDHVTSQPDYTSFAFAIENVPSFDQPNIHGSGHFGVGGVLGTIGDAYNSPGDPLFYLHHGNLDRILWEWQSKDLAVRLNQVGGPVAPFDYAGKNVTLDFEVNIGALAGNATLHDLLNSAGLTLCYTY